MKLFKNVKWEKCATLALAGCIIALFYLLVSHFGFVMSGIGKFLGFFSTVFTGVILAYLVNSPACFFNKKVLKNIKSDKKRWMISVVIALVLVLLFVVLSVAILIPQLIDSISLFVSNLDAYQESLNGLMQKLGIEKLLSDKYESLELSSEAAMETAVNYIVEKSPQILSGGAAAGKGIFNFVIALILCLYFLAEKENVSLFCKRVMKATISEKGNENTLNFLSKCNVILSQYVVYNIIDALIIGGVNAVFMIVTGMPYIGLISFVVGLTNLIPTFGPVIGLVICGFILVLVSPKSLLIFAVFTLVLQTCDAYIIKPKLFGNSLGIPGMLIIVGVIVGGNMAGIVGILLATPVVAIIDYTVKDLILPKLELKRMTKNIGDMEKDK